MGTLNIVLGIILIVAALFLVIAVLMQSGGSDNSIGVINGGASSGGSDNYLGKSKGKTRDKVLSKATTIVAIVFAVIVLLVYIFQDNGKKIDTDETTVIDDATAVEETKGEPEETVLETEAEVSGEAE